MRSVDPRERPPLGVPLFHSADAEKRLRALHAELRSTVRSCYALANELELAGDQMNVGRFGAAGAALERVLVEHFADLESRRGVGVESRTARVCEPCLPLPSSSPVSGESVRKTEGCRR